MPMPPSPYTSIEVLLAIFESYMHNCTTTSIEALLPMSKYYIYKQAIHLFLLQNVELSASRWFGLSTGRRSGDGSKLWTSVFRSVCGNHGWDCEIVQLFWENGWDCHHLYLQSSPSSFSPSLWLLTSFSSVKAIPTMFQIRKLGDGNLHQLDKSCSSSSSEAWRGQALNWTGQRYKWFFLLEYRKI